MMGFAILVAGQLIAFQRPTARLRLHLLTMLPTILLGDSLMVYGSVNVLLDPQSEQLTHITLLIAFFLVLLVHVLPELHLLGRWFDLRRRIEEVEGRLSEQAEKSAPKQLGSASRLSERSFFVLNSQLSDTLRNGDIALISTAWLMSQPPNYRLQRRQLLPPEALITPDAATRFLEAGQVALLSYRWLQPGAPDQFPGSDGFHMQAVRSFFFDPKRPLLSAWRQWRLPALFWDYGSLYQLERTAEEEASFRRALKVMASAYASPRTIVLQHKALPFDFPIDEPTYEGSGWCTMEQAAASLAAEVMRQVKIHELGRGWIHRPETRSPGEMGAIFKNKSRTRFIGHADREQVARMYEELYVKVRRFERVNIPFLAKNADRLVIRMPLSLEQGTLLLLLYFAAIGVVSYLLMT